MSLIPQDTLLGLPDELIVEIVRYAVKTDLSIDTCKPESANTERLMLAPFMGIEKLESIARAAYYETNLFRTEPDFKQQHEELEGEADAEFTEPSYAILSESHVDRRPIKHLHVTLWTLAVDLAYEILEEQTEIADAEICILNTLPELYPNLQTLVVELTHVPRIPTPPDYLDLPDEWPVFVATQMQRALLKLIASVRTLNFPQLRSKTLLFTQDTNEFLDAESAEEAILMLLQQPKRNAMTIDRRDEPVNVWEVMDLPRIRVKL